MEDNDVLHVVGGGYGIYNTRQADVETAVPRKLQVLQMEVDQIMKVSSWGAPPALAGHTSGEQRCVCAHDRCSQPARLSDALDALADACWCV